MAGLSASRSDEPVRVSAAPVRVSVTAAATGWLFRRLWRVLVVVVTTPPAMAGLLLVVAAVALWRLSPPLMLLVLGLGAGLLVGWRLRFPAGFLRWLRLPVRAWRRGWLLYRHRWAGAMDPAGLATSWRATTYSPMLLALRSTLSVDRVRVRMLPGQTVEDYAQVADRLAQTFGALVCRVRSVPKRVHEVELWLLTAHPLPARVPPLPVEPNPLTSGVPVAVAEDGQIWRLQLVG